MHIDWRKVAHIGAIVATAVGIGPAMAIEAQVEAAVDAKTGPEKAALALEAAIKGLEAEGAIAGKNYATPRVQAALRALNNDSVELVNALADANAVTTPVTP